LNADSETREHEKRAELIAKLEALYPDAANWKARQEAEQAQRREEHKAKLEALEDKARALLERLRWPEGPTCPHCGQRRGYKLRPKEFGESHIRKGVWKCSGCRRQYTVTVGTIFEHSHMPLDLWQDVIALLCTTEEEKRRLLYPRCRRTPRKDINAHQIHLIFDVTYKSALSMARRILYAMSQEPLSSKLDRTPKLDDASVGDNCLPKRSLSLAPLETEDAISCLLKVRPESKLYSLGKRRTAKARGRR
jgi:transposase-like protein